MWCDKNGTLLVWLSFLKDVVPVESWDITVLHKIWPVVLRTVKSIVVGWMVMPRKRHVHVRASRIVTVTLFRKTVFAVIFKVRIWRWDHLGVCWWALNSVTCPYRTQRRQRQIAVVRSTAYSHQTLEEAENLQERGAAETVASGLWPLKLKRINFFFFETSSLW